MECDYFIILKGRRARVSVSVSVNMSVSVAEHGSVDNSCCGAGKGRAKTRW